MFDYIWTKEDGIDIEELEPFNETILKEVESKLGVKLPTTYVRLMREKNGGTLAYNEFHYKKLPDGELLVDSLKGIALDDGIGENEYYIEEWDLPKGLILLSGDGHSWVALDYRNNNGNNPPVCYVDSESGKNIQIASDFEEFIKGLKEPEPWDDDGLEDDDNLDEELNKEYTKDEVEDYVNAGDSPFDIVCGLNYFSTKEGDSEWFFEQVKKAINSEYADQVWEVEEAVLVKLKYDNNEELPIELLNEIVSKLLKYPNEYVNRLAKRIQRKIS